MKIALCISGQMRTFRRCYDHLARYILDSLQPDVFVHTWSKSGQSENLVSSMPFNSLRRLGRFDFRRWIAHFSVQPEEEAITLDVLDRLYNPKLSCVEDFESEYTTSFTGVTVPEILRKTEPIACRGAIPMSYKIHACNELRKSYEKKVSMSYDIVIRLRPDLDFLESIPEYALDGSDAIWFNSKAIDTQWQASDRLAVSSSLGMDYYASLWLKLNEYWKDPLADGNKMKYRVGERLMRQHLDMGSFPVKEFECDSPILRE